MRFILLFSLYFTTLSAHPIIIMLTHPRAVATAYSRLIHERGDVEVMIEPLTYLFTLKYCPKSETLSKFNPTFPKTYSDLKKHLFEKSKQTPIFIKEVARSVIPFIIDDLEFVNHPDVHFMILIRHPIKSLPSMYKMAPECNLQFTCYDTLYQASLALPISYILDSDDLESDPESAYFHFCKTFHLPFLPEALTFYKDPLEDLQGRWYERVRDLTKIEKSTKAYPVDDKGEPLFEEIDPKDRPRYLMWYRLVLPYYEKIKQGI